MTLGTRISTVATLARTQQIDASVGENLAVLDDQHVVGKRHDTAPASAARWPSNPQVTFPETLTQTYRYWPGWTFLGYPHSRFLDFVVDWQSAPGPDVLPIRRIL